MGNKKDENQLEIAEMAKEKDVVKPKIKVEEKAENKTEKKEQPKIEIKDEKLKNIVKKAKETGKRKAISNVASWFNGWLCCTINLF